MARYLRSLLVFACAASASVLSPSNHGALVQQGRGPMALRKQVCQYCHKLCPISCFVGTCSLHMGFTTRKFEATNQCFSCDPAVSVGINKDGDYMRCEADESGVTGGASPFSQQQGIKQGPQGPAVPGNAGVAALKAQIQAQEAVYHATSASIWAAKAAQAATAQYRKVTGTDDAAQAFSSEAQAENHQQAAQIRASEALRVAEAAHTAWKAAMDAYNRQVARLRREQLLTDQAEKILEAAEKASEKARGEYASMQAVATQAMQEVMATGGSAASKITSQAAAEELAGAAMAAHRRLVTAAKEAKDATEKIAMASSLAPCQQQTATVLGAAAVTGCVSVMQQHQQDQKIAATKIVHFMQPTLPAPPPPASSLEEHVEGLGNLDDEPAVPLEGQLEIPSIAQQMSQSLAEKLANNPAAVEDPSLFSVPQVPFSDQQRPVDGNEKVPDFDLATISTLQTQQQTLQKQQRRMLRKRNL